MTFADAKKEPQEPPNFHCPNFDRMPQRRDSNVSFLETLAQAKAQIAVAHDADTWRLRLERVCGTIGDDGSAVS
jgi:hypothetical protein